MTPDKIWETFLTVVGGIISGVVGLFTGWLLNKWQRESERAAGIEDRKRTFIAFMVGFKTKADRMYADGGYAVFHSEQIPGFQTVASLIRNDFTGAKQIRFKELVESVAHYNRSKSEFECQEHANKAIAAIIEFVESN